MGDALREALRMLETLTPLKTDCGRVCGGACCESAEGEETGMLLFPGEAERYAGVPGFTVRKTADGSDLLICDGECDRTLRPLSCRIFPLLPVVTPEGIRVKTDLRAKAVCPLSRQGIGAMDPAFVDAVRRAGELLAGEPEQYAFLEKLTREREELLQLRKRF